MSSLKDYLQAKDDFVYESVVIPEWDNKTVWVRSLTNKEKSMYEQSCIRKKRILVKGKTKETQETDLMVVRAKLVCFATCKGDGDKTPEFDVSDYEWLMTKNAAAMERIVDVAMRLCGMTNDDVEDLVGN